MACYFISYNSADLDWAEWIVWQLEDNGHRTIIQEGDFVPGTNFALKMDEAAAKADKIIAVLSPSYLDAMYTQPEWAAAFAKDSTGTESKLIPVRVKECTPDDLLKQITAYIDLVGLDEHSAKERFLSKIQTERLRAQEAPVFAGDINTGLHAKIESQQENTPTDLARTKFINDGFEKLIVLLEQYMVDLKSYNPGVEYTIERVDARKVLVSTCVQGELKYGLKAWLSNDFGTVDSIKMFYGRSVYDNDNSCNEQIIVEEERGELFLKPLLNSSLSGKRFRTMEEIVGVLMENLLIYFR